jgi:hypothetical protein
MVSSDPFDAENFRMNGEEVNHILERSRPKSKPVRPPRHRPGDWFVKGPVPWRWVEAMAQLPGKAWALSWVLWREAGRNNSRTVKLCLSCVGLGVSEQAARRALKALEQAGLVSVCRQPGHGIEVTILNIEEA